MFQTEWSPRPADCTAGPAVVGEGLYENIAFSIFMGALFDVANRFVPGLILPMAYPPYTKLADKDRMMWDVKFINVLFSVVIIPLAFYCRNYDEGLMASPINGTSFATRLCAATAAGFFLWDVFICVRYLKEWGFSFLFHGLFCLGIYLQVAWFQVTVSAALGALYYEASTPFLNARWYGGYMQQAKAYSHPLFNVLTYAFALTFIAVRIGYGGWHTYNILIMTTTETCLPAISRGLAAAIIIASFGLNCKWAYDIVASATKMRKPKADGKKSS